MKVKEAIEYLRRYDQNEEIVHIIWSKEDVLFAAEERGLPLPDDNLCEKVIGRVDRHYDANNGVTWDTLATTLQMFCEKSE